jgi:hypothetical protein
MAFLSDELQGCSELLHNHEDTIPVTSPEWRWIGCIHIPRKHTRYTVGIERCKNNGLTGSICQLFRDGKCRAYGLCNQIHVRKKYHTYLDDVLKQRGCCFYHKDLASTSRVHMLDILALGNVSVQNSTGGSTSVPTQFFAYTLFWSLFELQTKRAIENKEVCRLHQQGVCNYGWNCRFVHICKQFWNEAEVQATDDDMWQYTEYALQRLRDDMLDTNTTVIAHKVPVEKPNQCVQAEEDDNR